MPFEVEEEEGVGEEGRGEEEEGLGGGERGERGEEEERSDLEGEEKGGEEKGGERWGEQIVVVGGGWGSLRGVACLVLLGVGGAFVFVAFDGKSENKKVKI